MGTRRMVQAELKVVAGSQLNFLDTKLSVGMLLAERSDYVLVIAACGFLNSHDFNSSERIVFIAYSYVRTVN